MRNYTIDEAMDQLNELGIPIKRYARAPLGKNIFVISIGDRYRKNERICLWPGTVVRADISTNKRYGQAVFTVFEESQKVVSTTTLDYWNRNRTIDVIKKNWREAIHTAFPPGTRCLKAEELEGLGTDAWGNMTRRVKFTVRTPSAERCFLLGYDADGKHVFISMLPETANSVKHSHTILKPDEVPKGSIRQGEFFFVPAPDYDPGNIEVEKRVGIWSVLGNRKTPKRRGIWSDYAHHISDHVAAELVVDWPNSLQHVRGVVSNRRHKPRNLSGWHKVVINNEIPQPSNARTWD